MDSIYSETKESLADKIKEAGEKAQSHSNIRMAIQKNASIRSTI